MSTSREVLPTILAFKRFLSRMCAVVAGKITPSTKMFTAKFTLVRLFTRKMTGGTKSSGAQ
jgi:hypothetical protein